MGKEMVGYNVELLTYFRSNICYAGISQHHFGHFLLFSCTLIFTNSVLFASFQRVFLYYCNRNGIQFIIRISIQ